MAYQNQNDPYGQNDDPYDPYGLRRPRTPQSALVNGLGSGQLPSDNPQGSFTPVGTYPGDTPNGSQGYNSFDSGLPITNWGDLPNQQNSYQLQDDPNRQPTNNPNQQTSYNSNQIGQWYQKYMGRTGSPDEYANWLPGGSGYNALGGDPTRIEQAIAQSDEAKKRASSGGATGGDPQSQMAALYQKYGLDPNNPGHGLADIGYFMQRFGQTGNDAGYWMGANGQTGRLEQEIRHALYGEQGGLLDSGAGITPPNDYLTGVGDQLSKLIASLQTPVDFNTPGVAEPLGAYRTLANSQLEQEKGDLAQQYGVEGNGATLGGLNTAQQMAREQTGRGIAQYGGNLLNQQVQARRQQLTSALQMALQLGLTTQAQQIQEELAKLGLGYNYAALGAGLNQNSLLNALNG